ncbi:MAG: hypothetical protein ACR2G0_08120 [Chthoniobacterales bacterium]
MFSRDAKETSKVSHVIKKKDERSSSLRLTNKGPEKVRLGNVAKVPFQELFGLLSKLTPAEIAKLAEQLRSLPRGSASEAKIVAFYKAWAALDADSALASALKMTDAQSLSTALAAVLRGADAGFAGKLAHTLHDLPNDRLSVARKTSLLSSAVTKWAEVEPISAAQFLDAIGANGLDYITAFNSTANGWAAQDPAAALSWAQHHPDGNGNLALQGALNGWWKKDPKAAEAYVAAQAGTNGDKFMARSFAGMLFSADPEHAREWISQLPSASVRAEANSAIAQYWALENPQAAAAWATDLPADEQGNSIGGIAYIWGKQDAKAAGDFLNSLGGSVRDQAVASFSASLAYQEPANAFTWAATISDPNLRQTSLDAVAGDWLKNDRMAAVAWIQKSSLPTEEKNRLLAQAPSP